MTAIKNEQCFEASSWISSLKPGPYDVFSAAANTTGTIATMQMAKWIPFIALAAIAHAVDHHPSGFAEPVCMVSYQYGGTLQL